MEESQYSQAIRRILRWRFERPVNRVLQVLLICVLAMIATGNAWAGWWTAATLLAMAVDAAVGRWALARPGDQRALLAAYGAFVITASVFTSIGLVFLASSSPNAITQALLITAAIMLNTAVMARGATVASLILSGPSALLLAALPFVAPAFGHPVGVRDMIPMTVGSLFYTAILFKLTRTLNAEGDALRGALDAAKAANDAKSSFLATMSHEIRTPLNGVLGMAQAMARDPLPQIQRERLEVVSQSGETLLAILNDILDLSKIEAGKLDLEYADFDLEALARGAHGAFTAAANGKGLSFNLVIDPTARGVYRGDSVRVRQVLYNLIANAVKFTEIGSVGVRIDRAEHAVRMVVSDTGVGVEPDRIAYLFDKFVQADSSTTRRFGGTGLGLSICAELCKAMGGTIQAASAHGRGSTFTVELPLERVADAIEAPRAASAAGEPASLEAGAGLKVLAAEDNPVNQLVLKTLLAQLGVWPVIVADGAAAVEAWAAEPWDLILMDVQMPLMDGPDATRAIRAREAQTGRPPTPIIALTANAMTHQVESYRAAGMSGFVAKPINVGELFAAMSEALEAPTGAPASAASLTG